MKSVTSVSTFRKIVNRQKEIIYGRVESNEMENRENIIEKIHEYQSS